MPASQPVPGIEGHSRSATAPTTRTFTEEAVQTAANQAAEDILAAVEGGSSGKRDALNLLVNATLSYVTRDAHDLTEAVDQNYDATFEQVLSWIAEAA